MRDKISALMDGELDNKDMKDTITQIEELEELQNKWRAYHLIGDALREPVISKLNVTSDIRNTMGMEPDVLTPALSNKGNKGKFFLFAAAASIFVTVTVVAWIGGQTIEQELNQVADKAVITPVELKNKFASTIENPGPVLAKNEESKDDKSALRDSAPTQLNDYMFAHEELTSIRGVSPYMRTVASRPYK
tara:strand:+ start:5601 stop:6173 length:573 start_codon:yes stop_codon:yes gene_type:complete